MSDEQKPGGASCAQAEVSLFAGAAHIAIPLFVLPLIKWDGDRLRSYTLAVQQGPGLEITTVVAFHLYFSK